jgi:uncharacterized membrane protein YecN with MAPEG domain
MSGLHLPVTAFYSGLLGVVMLTLAALVSGLRMRLRSSIRTDDTPQLHEAVRRHGNFVEWVPFALLLMAIAELNGLPRSHLHVAGAVLVAARVLHPFGIRHNVIPQPLRALGSTLTFLTTLYLSAVVLWQGIGSLGA